MALGAATLAGLLRAEPAPAVDEEQLEGLVPPSAPLAPPPASGWKRWPSTAPHWPRAAALGATAAAVVVLLIFGGRHLVRTADGLGAGGPASGPAAARPGAATGLAAERGQEEGPQLLAGNWSYGPDKLYRISRDDQGVWHFTEDTASGHEVSASLLPRNGWLEGELSSKSGRSWGRIRVRRGQGQTLVSNFLPYGDISDWDESQDVVAREAGTEYFVFLEVFRLSGTSWVLGGLYHSQMLICPKSEFQPEERRYIQELEIGSSRFAEVPEAWWRQSGARCVAVSFGGARDGAPCSGVGERQQGLGELAALIPNVDAGVAWKYYYGAGGLSGLQATKRVCSPGCGRHWAGTSYDMLSNNCNTFTSTVLHCVYGLSQQKPDLGVSDMQWASCKC
mmetsp:Transcript_127153/g.354061  ORF Transcript_127153/g.354061 Transcript_127153/m.354061 type:complete len:393 (-) Transcript_127153:328-1506(-)